jgi:hypothetical protein
MSAVLQPLGASESRLPGMAANSTHSHPVDQHLYLTGRPRLKDFIRYVNNNAVEGCSEGAIADRWRAAADVLRELEIREAGAADNPDIQQIGPDYEPLLIEFLKDPLVRNGFNTVPTEVAFVELDRLVVYQKHIDLTFVGQLERQIGPTPGRDEIFRTCLPYDHPHPPARWTRVHGDRFIFVSPSNDLRFLGTMPLEPNEVAAPAPGDLLAVVGVAVGFGSNFMNAVYAENRLILNNGSHRAFLLRKLGFTHAPCIVQHVQSRHELELVASSDVRQAPDLFLKHPRPMMLRDYFNPAVHQVMTVHRRFRQVIVKFEIEEHYVPAL